MEHIAGHLVVETIVHVVRYMVKGTLRLMVAFSRRDPEDTLDFFEPLAVPSARPSPMAVEVMSPALNELDGEFRGMCMVAAVVGGASAYLVATLASGLWHQVDIWFLSDLRDLAFQAVCGGPLALAIGLFVSLRLVPLGKMGPVVELRRHARWRQGAAIAYIAGLVFVSGVSILLTLRVHK